jgi:zinc protease
MQVSGRKGREHRMQSSRQRGVQPKLDVERVELPNGLVLLLSENHSTPSISINSIILAGSRYETDEKAGLASLVGELLDEGTATRTGQQIAETVESVGGRLATYGNYQSSGVLTSFLSKDASLAFDVISDILTGAAFPEAKVRQHVERRVAQIKGRLDVPRTKASDLFNEIIFHGSPLHRPAIGFEGTVSHLTREDVIAFFRRFYVPNNTLMAVVGDFDKTEVKQRVADLLGGWTRAEGFESPVPPKPGLNPQAIERFASAPKEQVNVFIGHVGIERANPDYYALLVMDTILGSSPGFTSRIPRILRDEMGLAYTTFSNITSSAGIDPGRFVAYIGTAPENLDRAIAGLRHEIERIVSEPVSERELEVAKNYLTGSFVFHFQKNSQIAEFLIEAELYGLGFDYLEEFPEKIRAVTVDDIARVTREYIHPERLVTVVVGPVDESGRILAKDLSA